MCRGIRFQRCDHNKLAIFISYIYISATALTAVTKDIFSALDRRQVTVLIFLDPKSFDWVSHQILFASSAMARS